MTGRRLDGGVAGGGPVRFRWDGREVEGQIGEPLAVALLASGRRILSRSFRFHRPRGFMCASGTCGWCECAVDGRPGVRSCRAPLREGLEARGEHAWPSVATDILAVLDLASRLITPGFYHHRFLRPFRFRKLYLDVIRGFGGRGTVRSGLRPRSTARTSTLVADVLVVGAGPGGLAAAIAAAEAGARVVVVETEAEPGGSGRWLRGGAVTAALVDRATSLLGDGMLFGTTAVAREGQAMRCVGDGTLVTIEAPVVVAATGSRERPPMVPGSDRPGVIGARASAWLIARWGVAPGERAVIIDDGPESEAIAAALRRAGIQVMARVAEGDLLGVWGFGGVRGARVLQSGRVRDIAADLVIFSRRAPSLELPALAGAAVRQVAAAIGPVVDADGATTVPWLFIAGSATGLGDTPEVALERARRAGVRAAELARGRAAIGGRAPSSASSGPRAASAARMAVPPVADAAAFICYCEDVRVRDVAAERLAGYDDPELVKRRTGALTGPCQGKFCLDRFMTACDADGATVGPDAPVLVPTARPPLQPIRLASLVTDEDAP